MAALGRAFSTGFLSNIKGIKVYAPSLGAI
jgi:hypothetical protein